MPRGKHRFSPGALVSDRYKVLSPMADSWVPTSGSGARGRHRARLDHRLQKALAVTTALVSLLGVGTVLVTTEEPAAAIVGAQIGEPLSVVASSMPQTTLDETPTSIGVTSEGLVGRVGEVWDQVAGAGGNVEGEPRQLRFAVNEEGLVVAEEIDPFAPATTVVVATTTTSTTVVTIPATTVVDFGRPTLWLASFVAPAMASAVVPGDGRVVVLSPEPDDARGCYLEARLIELRNEKGGYDRNAIAQMTHSLFQCLGRVNGLADEPPSKTRSWDAAAVWGFPDLAAQVAAEAVVVAYCESVGFAGNALNSNNAWGYGGLFQMGTSEMRRFGGSGLSKFDAVDNAYASANYFLFQRRNGAGWGGWSPWAVVNTNFDDDVNNQVKVPVLPRFRSTDPDLAGRRGAELPEWAVDPWSFTVPSWAGCPYNGGRWAGAVPID